MRGILTEISKTLAQDPNFRADILNYIEMKKHDGWLLHQKMLLTMRGMIAEEMLSSRFTKLDEHEKDVHQRTYHNVNEVIGFLLNPLERAAKKAQFERNFEREINQRMTANATQRKP